MVDSNTPITDKESVYKYGNIERDPFSTPEPGTTSFPSPLISLLNYLPRDLLIFLEMMYEFEETFLIHQTS